MKSRSRASSPASTMSCSLKGLPWLLCLGMFTACSALLSKSEPLSVRYFSPPERVGQAKQGPLTGAVPLRLGRVAGAAYLDVRIVYRKADNELLYDEVARWSEAPTRYLERALAHALFEERGIPQAVSGQALTLEAELLAFEQAQGPSGDKRARMSVAFTLHDERISRVVESFTVERDLAEGGPEALVAALSSALDESVDRITTRVVSELAR